MTPGSSEDPGGLSWHLPSLIRQDLHNVPKHEGDDAHVLRRTLHPGQKYGYDDDRRTEETIEQQKQELSKQKQELSQQKQEIERLRRELEEARQKK